MHRARLRVLAIAVAAFVAAGVLASTASATHVPTGFTEVALADGHMRTIDNVAVANLGGNPLLFLQGCYGHPAVGTLFGYQNAGAAVVEKVPGAGQQPQSVYSYGGGLTVPDFPVFTSDGTMSPYTASALPSPVVFIELPGGNVAIGIAFDPSNLTGTPFTRNAIAINIKDPAGNGLTGSPIVSLNGELAQVVITGPPTTTPPPRFPQPIQWACDRMNDALKAIKNALSPFAFAYKLQRAMQYAKGSRAQVQREGNALKKAVEFLQEIESDIEDDDYRPAIETIPPTLSDFKTCEVASKALAPRIISPASKRKFLKAQQQAIAAGRAALTTLQGAVTVA